MQNEVGTGATKVKGIPDNSSIIIPRLVCREPGKEIDFCVEVFEAKVLNRRPGPNGTVWHGLLTIREDADDRSRSARVAMQSAGAEWKLAGNDFRLRARRGSNG